MINVWFSKYAFNYTPLENFFCEKGALQIRPLEAVLAPVVTDLVTEVGFCEEPSPRRGVLMNMLSVEII